MRNWPPYLCLYFAADGVIYYIPSGDGHDSFLALRQFDCMVHDTIIWSYLWMFFGYAYGTDVCHDCVVMPDIA